MNVSTNLSRENLSREEVTRSNIHIRIYSKRPVGFLSVMIFVSISVFYDRPQNDFAAISNVGIREPVFKILNWLR